MPRVSTPRRTGGKAVGSVGGLKIPPVDRYIAGYQYGAKKAFPGIKMLNDYSQDFVAQAKCKEKALNQIAQGSVVEFQVAGQCGLGVLDAARSKKVFGIGVDADQGYLGSQVMTSALKKVDVAVYTAITGAKNGTLKGGTNAIFGAKVERRRLRQVEPEGSARRSSAGGRAVHAAEGRQDQGHPDDRQVRPTSQVLSGTGRAARLAPFCFRCGMRTAAALLVLAFALGGCGGGKRAAATTTTAATATTRAADGPAHRRRRAALGSGARRGDRARDARAGRRRPARRRRRAEAAPRSACAPSRARRPGRPLRGRRRLEKSPPLPNLAGLVLREDEAARLGGRGRRARRRRKRAPASRGSPGSARRSGRSRRRSFAASTTSSPAPSSCAPWSADRPARARRRHSERSRAAPRS